MRLSKKSVLTSCFLVFSVIAFPQETKPARSYPQDFRSPLDIKPSLAGSFGEIRSNHFHSGLDYRTNQREGYPVFAAADGFIARLRVQAGGFGKAVYISHPNGFTSVYAHLQRFSQPIGRVVKEMQYKRESFEVDFPPGAGDIPVRKGEIIGWSGNSGSSGGPHLHFEIRDSKTEETINPQLFGLQVPDNTPPVISALYMYRFSGDFSDKTPSQYFQINGSGGNYKLNQSPVINFSGKVGFGISTYDQQTPGGNKNGVYSTELFLDDRLLFQSTLERFRFDDSRAINSHIDYPALKSYGRTVQKSFIEPGNPLQIYQRTASAGQIELSDDWAHTLKYVVRDVKGNTSTLNFEVQRNDKAVVSVSEPAGLKRISYADSTSYSAERMRVAFPKGVLYSDINLRYGIGLRPTNGYSSVHHIHTALIPVHRKYHLWIKPDKPIPEHLREKAAIVDTRGAYHGGWFEEGFIKGMPSTFGSFYIRLDTIAPSIRPLNISDGKSMQGASKLSFIISDNLSGIKSYSGTIDGQWMLFEFDAKTATLWHTLDNLSSGKHFLQLTVTDMKNNSKTFNATFYR